jgi:hypothetical protein
MTKLSLTLLAALVFLLTAAPGGGSSGGSRSSGGSSGGSSFTGGSSSRTTTTTYKAPPVGTSVVVTQPRNGPAVTAKVPPPQTAGSTVRTTATYRVPYSPSGYTDARGRATIYSPVTRNYVQVNHYFYSDYHYFGWHPFYGYYGCLYCWSGPYSYAPIPMAPTAYTQPSWGFDVELLFLFGLILFLMIYIPYRIGRRRTY